MIDLIDGTEHRHCRQGSFSVVLLVDLPGAATADNTPCYGHADPCFLVQVFHQLSPAAAGETIPEAKPVGRPRGCAVRPLPGGADGMVQAASCC